MPGAALVGVARRLSQICQWPVAKLRHTRLEAGETLRSASPLQWRTYYIDSARYTFVGMSIGRWSGKIYQWLY